jgi:Protein of unknown function (DUF982)
MNNTLFEEPVTVLVGLGFPRRIESAIEAHQLLSDMRLTANKAAHTAALHACKAAIDGEVDPEIARSAFVAFARRSAMLISKVPPFRTNPVLGLPRTDDGVRPELVSRYDDLSRQRQSAKKSCGRT